MGELTVSTKQRLDQFLLAQYPQFTRNQLQSWIMQGKVLVNGKTVTKSGTPVAADAHVELTVQELKYVGRAGFKLEKALDTFGIDVKDLVVMDAGLSTGGFTDCLLQRGARRVYGVDVGYGQVHEKIRADPRVIVMERVNLRYLESLPEPVDLVTLDLSFISVLKVMDAVLRVLKPHGSLVVLVKPQFEAGRDEVETGGLITDPEVHEKVINQVVSGVCERGLEHKGLTESPIHGSSGNKEFSVLCAKASIKLLALRPFLCYVYSIKFFKISRRARSSIG